MKPKQFASIGSIPKDEAEAIRLFREAAAKGDSTAMYSLASAYDQGLGVPKDGAEAARWMFSAIENGDSFAAYQMNNNPSGWSSVLRKELQNRMREAGVYSGPSDADFGPAMKQGMELLAARKKPH